MKCKTKNKYNQQLITSIYRIQGFVSITLLSELVDDDARSARPANAVPAAAPLYIALSIPQLATLESGTFSSQGGC